MPLSLEPHAGFLLRSLEYWDTICSPDSLQAGSSYICSAPKLLWAEALFCMNWYLLPAVAQWLLPEILKAYRIRIPISVSGKEKSDLSTELQFSSNRRKTKSWFFNWAICFYSCVDYTFYMVKQMILKMNLHRKIRMETKNELPRSLKNLFLCTATIRFKMRSETCDILFWNSPSSPNSLCEFVGQTLLGPEM